MDVLVREARESELDEIGALTVEIYELDGLVGPEYLRVLRDARSRWQAPATTLFVALDGGTDEPEGADSPGSDADGSLLLGAVVYAGPGSPWQNPFVESFGGKVRDEVLAVEAFDSLLEAKTVIEEWRNSYNTTRPHSSLNWKTPAAYAATWRQN